MKKHIVVFILSLASAGLAQIDSDSLCTLTGTVYNQNGNPIANSRFVVSKVSKNGVLVVYGPQTYFTDAYGIVTIILPRRATACIEGNIAGYSQPGGGCITVPNDTVGTLEALQPVTVTSTTGLTIENNNASPKVNIATIDFSSLFTVTESPTREANVTIRTGSITNDIGVPTSNYSSVVNALTAGQDSSWRIIVPYGLHVLTDSIKIWQPLLIEASSRGTSRGDDPVSEIETDSTGSRIYVQINNGQAAIIDTTAGTRLRDFALLADTSKTTGDGIRFRRPRQSTTMGNWHVDGVTIKGFKGHGVHAYAPDNNSVLMHSHIVENKQFGLFARNSTGSSAKGLNMMVLYNRFLSNDSGAIRNWSIHHSLFQGNGILGSQNGKPLIDLRGNTGSLAYNLFIANDIEGEAGGDGTRSPLFQMYNTRGDIWIGNRIGQSESDATDTTGTAGKAAAVAVRGQVRSLLSIQNRYVGWANPATDSIMIVHPGGTLNLFQIGDHTGFHGKDIKVIGSGGYRYFDMWLDRDSLFAAIDTGSPSATFKGLYLNPYGNGSVHFYPRITAGKSGNVYFHGSRGAATGPDSIGVISTPNGTDAFQIKGLIGDLELFAATGFDVVVNEDSDADIDFRVESNSQSNMFKVDAADDAIGIGTGNPKHQISIYNAAPQLCMTDTDVNTGIGGTAAASDTASILLDASSTTSPQIKVRDSVGDTIFVIATDGGIIVGSGVTGLSKGKGTINAKAVYDDNSALSDFVFEPGYKIIPIDSMRAFYERNKHLPTIPGRAEWESKKPSLGELTNRLYETIEVQARYIAELHERLKKLEELQ